MTRDGPSAFVDFEGVFDDVLDDFYDVLDFPEVFTFAEGFDVADAVDFSDAGVFPGFFAPAFAADVELPAAAFFEDFWVVIFPVVILPVMRGSSRTTSSTFLSSRRPRNAGWRRRWSVVHSVKAT